MMESAPEPYTEHFRARARLFRERAAEVKSLGIYHSLCDMARHYDALADATEAGRLAPLPGPPSG